MEVTHLSFSSHWCLHSRETFSGCLYYCDNSRRDLLFLSNNNIVLTSHLGNYSQLVLFAEKITYFFCETVLAKYFPTSLLFSIDFSRFFSEVDSFLSHSSPWIFIHLGVEQWEWSVTLFFRGFAPRPSTISGKLSSFFCHSRLLFWSFYNSRGWEQDMEAGTQFVWAPPIQDVTCPKGLKVLFIFLPGAV